jgi:hypothetical protein
MVALLLSASMLSVSCVKDDGKDFNGLQVEQKSDPTEDVFTITSLDGKVDVILLNDEPVTEVATIICNDPYSNSAGHAVVKNGSSYYIVFWHTDPSKLPSGFSQTQYTSAFGGTRYMVSCPITEYQASIAC